MKRAYTIGDLSILDRDAVLPALAVSWSCEQMCIFDWVLPTWQGAGRIERTGVFPHLSIGRSAIFLGYRQGENGLARDWCG